MFASQLLKILEILPSDINNGARDFDAAGPKVTMKEDQRLILCDPKDCERDTNLPETQMKDQNESWKTQEFGCSMIVDDCSKVNGKEVRDSITSRALPSSATELSDKETEFYMDKNVMECGLRELIVCYRENTYHVVKDICVDEGVPSKEKILVESDKNCHKVDWISVPPSNGNENGDIMRKRVDNDLQITDDLKSFSEKDGENDAGNVCGTKITDGLKSSSEDCFRKDVVDEFAFRDSMIGERKCNATCQMEKFTANGLHLVGEFSDLVEFSDQDSPQSLLKSSSCDGDHVTGQILCEEAASECLAVGSAAEESNSYKVENGIIKGENGTISSDLNISTSVAGSGDTITENVGCEQPQVSQNVPKLEDGISDSLSAPSQVHYGPGESSFSAAGPVSGSITYSGHIAYSGSISLRSDSSTTSTRSFAFPILQSEWNSSPVRMAKADRRRLRKHGGWRQGLLCCRF